MSDQSVHNAEVNAARSGCEDVGQHLCLSRDMKVYARNTSLSSSPAEPQKFFVFLITFEIGERIRYDEVSVG